MAAPNAFSGHLEKWLYEKTKDSIFFINILPRPDQHGAIHDLMKTADHVEEGEREALVNGDGHCATGFVVENGPDHLKILTCAHIIEHVYSATDPVSTDDCNRVFITQVLCDHSELSFRRPGQIAHPQRVYAEGRIIGISYEDDLLLIQVPPEDVVDLDEICMRNHPHLTFSSTQPVAFDVCAMVSWPPLRHRTAVRGRVSHTSRSFDDLGQDNPVGYRMNLIEVRIGSELGSSGAPLVNGNGKVIGMLHGGFRDAFSYFLSLNDIMLFLAHRGVAVIRED
ncbi:hypothetical protein ACQ4PT_031969 [Festuca glaucescens]